MSKHHVSVGVINGGTFDFESGQNVEVSVPENLASKWQKYNHQRVVIQWSHETSTGITSVEVDIHDVELASESKNKPVLPEIEVFTAVPSETTCYLPSVRKHLKVMFVNDEIRSSWCQQSLLAINSIVIGRKHTEGHGLFCWVRVLDFVTFRSYRTIHDPLSRLLEVRKRMVSQMSGQICGDALIEKDDYKTTSSLLLPSPKLKTQWKTLDDGKSTVTVTYSEMGLEDGSTAKLIYSIEAQSDEQQKDKNYTDSDDVMMDVVLS